MSVNDKLIRQFILEITPQNFKHDIPRLLESMDEDSVMQFGSCWQILKTCLEDKEERMQVVAFNGFFTGICMMEVAIRNPKGFEALIQNFLEMRSKKRGENVVPIEQARIR